MKLGVCYYPEQWPEDWWADDARRMREMGISHVRLAEFSWALIEPEPGTFDWGWLDRAIDTLSEQGLNIIMCTPTATPPKWLIDAEPDILAVDGHGVVRHFGSRRHYCFSNQSYRRHSQRITRLVAERYGNHPAVVAWQTDNEYGCHDTVLSYSAAARTAFRHWLERRYLTIEGVNSAWGATFWSQRYRHFGEIDPPVATVTEANPSHRLDWQRFASDEVVAFNREQSEILRQLSPGRDITHNFMGFFTAFDHHKVSADLDVASWDSYPLGFTQMFFLSETEKTRWAFTGHPDIPGFHHDLYRGMCAGNNKGRWWVMEQQPGPVNWAKWNPAPANGMVRLWTWQAFAHGAELVSYFRWRQAPFAQEQMHAGLLRSDRGDDQGAVEAASVARELVALRKMVAIDRLKANANVAIVVDYEALWMAQIQPQGEDYNALELTFRIYSVMRQMGLNIDIVSPVADLSIYRLIVLPAQLYVSPILLSNLESSTAEIVLCPRSGSKTIDMHIPANLPPGPLGNLAGISVSRVESLPPGIVDKIAFDGATLLSSRWRETLKLNQAVAEASFVGGGAAITRHNNVRYVGVWLSEDGWRTLLLRVAGNAGLIVESLPATLRLSRIGPLVIACNFGDDGLSWQPGYPCVCVQGARQVPPRGVTIWKLVDGDALKTAGSA